MESNVHILKSKTTAIILSLLLGGFGTHHFYVGNARKGILYLMFCWTLIPAVIAFVDFIGLVTQSEDDFNLKHNPGEFYEKYRKPLQVSQQMTLNVNALYSSFEEYKRDEELLQLR
ncbi:TM2 domain-containing protein [Rufibacter sp. XAAS-G3-1]|uniref:TM2 domain-containing protein n=1 Tax=Rufibacter sp. XAAS-G3-1 TaxID=2729134 RepID=UPI0015E6489D|nr:TM2 domain-containing protein [Rufibacter sp. XAAS-G3-1]